MPDSITQEEELETIEMMNENPKLDGILVQLPFQNILIQLVVLKQLIL